MAYFISDNLRGESKVAWWLLDRTRGLSSLWKICLGEDWCSKVKILVKYLRIVSFMWCDSSIWLLTSSLMQKSLFLLLLFWKKIVFASPSHSQFILNFNFQKSSSLFRMVENSCWRLASNSCRNLLKGYASEFWMLVSLARMCLFLWKILPNTCLFQLATLVLITLVALRRSSVGEKLSCIIEENSR